MAGCTAYTPQIFKIFVITVLAVWMLLYLYFHDWRGALRPTISGVICAIWGLGFIRMIGFTLDPLVLVIPFLITARAVSHSVQMHDRYYEEYYRLRDKQKAILSAFAELFVPSFSGILADAFGVLVILLVPVLFLQKLAITASFWIARDHRQRAAAQSRSSTTTWSRRGSKLSSSASTASSNASSIDLPVRCCRQRPNRHLHRDRWR